MAISKVIYGDDTLIDITDSTIDSDNMLQGTVGYDSAGVRTVGSAVIPTVNDSTITIQENSNTVDTFTLNQSSNKTIDIPVNQSYYGTCVDNGDVVAKTVTISNQNFKLATGALISVKFSSANSASNVTLNVNGTGDKSIWYNGSVYTGASGNVCGYTDRITTYIYDGTYWVWQTTGVVIDSNTHRPINVNGTQLLGNNTTAVNFKNGTNTTVVGSGADIQINATDTTYTGTGLISVNASTHVISTTATANTGTVTSVTIKGTSPITSSSETAITGSGTVTLSHATSGATAGSYGDSSAQTPSYGGTFKVPYVTVNNTGHVTGISEHTVKIPASDNTDENVKQTNETSSTSWHRVLFSGTADNSEHIEGAKKNTEILFQPSTGTLRTKRFKVENNDAYTVYPTVIDMSGRTATAATDGGQDIKVMQVSFKCDYDYDVTSGGTTTHYSGTKTHTTYPISVIANSSDKDGYNSGVRLGSVNGTTIVGAGESSDDYAKAKSVYNNENLYLTADGNIYFENGLSNDASTSKCYMELVADNTEDGLRLYNKNGVANTAKSMTIRVGNDINKTTAGNSYGVLKLFSQQTQAVNITPADQTGSDKTIYLPNKNGTFALTSDIPTIPGVVSTSANGLAPKVTDTSKYLKGDGTWDTPTGTYSLPLAASGTRGGIKIGYSENGTNYAVKLSSEKAYVTVPWTDTTYTFAEGSANGKFTVTPSGGSAQSVTVHGLGSAAYTNSTAYATSDHVHGNITNAGTITSDTTKASGDKLVLIDADNNKVVRSDIALGTSTSTYLRNDGSWATPTNTYDRNRYTGSITAGAAITAKNIIVARASDGKYVHLKTNKVAFDVRYPILYANADIASGSTGNNNYDVFAIAIATTQSLTLTAYKPVYIKGTLSGCTFTTLGTAPLTQTVPSSDDGYVYMLLGIAYSTTNIYLSLDHRMFAFNSLNGFREVVPSVLDWEGPVSITTSSSSRTNISDYSDYHELYFVATLDSSNNIYATMVIPMIDIKSIQNTDRIFRSGWYQASTNGGEFDISIRAIASTGATQTWDIRAYGSARMNTAAVSSPNIKMYYR